MTLPITLTRNNYIGNNTTPIYGFDYFIFLKTDLLVTKRIIATGVETTLVLGADYTVPEADLKKPNGGNITLTAGNLLATEALTIRRVRPLTQKTDIRNQGDYNRAAHEDAFDHLMMVLQQQQDEIDRSIKMPETISTGNNTLPASIAANHIVMRNATNDGWNSGTIAASGNIIVPGGNGFAVYTGSNTFINRTITGSGRITVTNGDGQSGNPTLDIENGFRLPCAVGPQSTPNDTVHVYAGWVPDFTDPSSAPTTIADDAASAIAFPVVSGNSRIDLLVVDKDGTFSRVAGTEAASPVPPAYPEDKYVLCHVLVDETSDVDIEAADITPRYPLWDRPGSALSALSPGFGAPESAVLKNDTNGNNVDMTNHPSSSAIKNIQEGLLAYWDFATAPITFLNGGTSNPYMWADADGRWCIKQTRVDDMSAGQPDTWDNAKGVSSSGQCPLIRGSGSTSDTSNCRLVSNNANEGTTYISGINAGHIQPNDSTSAAGDSILGWTPEVTSYDPCNQSGQLSMSVWVKRVVDFTSLSWDKITPCALNANYPNPVSGMPNLGWHKSGPMGDNDFGPITGDGSFAWTTDLFTIGAANGVSTTINVWFHVGWTLDDIAGEAKWYHNGVLIATKSYTGVAKTALHFSNNVTSGRNGPSFRAEVKSAGTITNNQTFADFTGVGIWNRVLSLAEMQTIYNSGDSYHLKRSGPWIAMIHEGINGNHPAH